MINVVEEYIAKRKQEVNKNNEQEYLEFLDLTTHNKKLLEHYTHFLITYLLLKKKH